MSFVHPIFFWLLIPLVLFGYLRFQKRASAVAELHPAVLLENRRSLLVRLAPFIALFWMIVALARPVTTTPMPHHAKQGETIFLAIDASASMMAQDLKPSRYEFAKRSIEALLRRDNTHRFALLAFTTNALILSPPTRDKALIEAALAAFRPDFVLTHGTSLAQLLRYVAKFEGEEKKLVIFSDGGDGGDLDALLQQAKRGKITIYGVACATRRGATIPTARGPLRDESGRIVISMLNPLLADLSIESGGAFIEKKDPEAVAEAIEGALGDRRLEEAEATVRTQEWFWVPLSLGLLFFLAGTLGWRTTGRWRWGWRRWIAAGSAAILCTMPAKAGVLDLWHLKRGYEDYAKGSYEAALSHFKAVSPPTFESRYAQASTLYRLGAYKKAGRLLMGLKSSDPDLKRRVWYNLGNCAAKLGHYESARDYYAKALALGFDKDAMANLETIAFLKEKRAKKPASHANRRLKAASTSGGGARKKSASQRHGGRMGQGSGSQNSASGGTLGMKIPKNRTQKRMPMSSKVYEMINKGYVHEKMPW